MGEKKLNKIGYILRDQGRTNRWLAGKVGKSEVTVSRWVRNAQQPDLETLYRVADLLGVSIYDLLVENYSPGEETDEN